MSIAAIEREIDADGNMTSDAGWLYWWDAENRLTAMEEKGGATGPAANGAASAVPKRQRLEFAYDGESRRVRKRVLEWSAEMNSWVLRRDVRFLYDGWSMIAEFEAKGGASGPLALSATYAWGLDLSGTETGAGGVGGLLFVSLYSTTTTQTTVNNSQPPPTCILAPCYDGNGNVLAYADTVSGTVVARYGYDPFGQVMIREEAASVAGRLHHQFSTKYTDSETGLVYYGYRYYSPELGRWVSRDPIGEKGGLNLYGMVGNDASNKIDILGLLLRKYPLCKIAILVGHFSSVDIDIIEKTLRNPANGDISDALFVSLLTCFRKTANDDFDADRQIPDPDGTRQDNLIFPSSDADMRKHFMYDENRGDETVGAGLRKELRLSEQYSESLCNCCEKIAIYIRGIDDAGIRWTRNNLYGHMSAQTSVETFDCDSKQWTVQNPAIKHFKR